MTQDENVEHDPRGRQQHLRRLHAALVTRGTHHNAQVYQAVYLSNGELFLSEQFYFQLKSLSSHVCL